MSGYVKDMNSVIPPFDIKKTSVVCFSFFLTRNGSFCNLVTLVSFTYLLEAEDQVDIDAGL